MMFAFNAVEYAASHTMVKPLEGETRVNATPLGKEKLARTLTSTCKGWRRWREMAGGISVGSEALELHASPVASS